MSRGNISTVWVKHIKGEEGKEKFKEAVYGSKFVLDVLAKIIDDKRQVDQKSSTDDYHQGSWAYRQADKVGYKRALDELTELLAFKGKD